MLVCATNFYRHLDTLSALAFRHGQTGLAIQPLNLPMINIDVFQSQQLVDPSIAKPTSLMGQFRNALAEPTVTSGNGGAIGKRSAR